MQEISGFLCHSALRRGLAGVVATFLIGACGEPPPAAKAATASCGTEGSFRAELYGGLQTVIDWRTDQVQCQGMPRPNGAGARLRFAGPLAGGREAASLAFILGIPNLERGKVAKELPTNVTIIDEEHGRFFATQDTKSCWSDIDRQQASETDYKFVVSGILYCVAPLAELHGNTSIRLSEVHFVGLLNWKQP